MTCIVGYVSNGRVFMGGDSACGFGNSELVLKNANVFRKGYFIIGCTTSFRMAQLLEFGLIPPPKMQGISTLEYMATVFVDAVRATLKAGGFAAVRDEEESGGHFLVGYEGQLFHIQPDFSVIETIHGFDAVGCGDAVALGAMAASEKADPAARILCALEAAETFCAGVRRPFIIDAEALRPMGD